MCTYDTKVLELVKCSNAVTVSNVDNQFEVLEEVEWDWEGVMVPNVDLSVKVLELVLHLNYFF